MSRTAENTVVAVALFPALLAAPARVESQESSVPAATSPAQPEPSVADLVRDLHEGRIAVDDLPTERRRECVSHLTLEGFSSAQIAGLLKVSDRQVRRDRAAVRKDEAVTPDLKLGDELLGEFQRIALASIQRLTRLCGDAAQPVYARLWAEEAIVRIHQRLIQTAQRIHYLCDGQRRLMHLIDTDPEERSRVRERMAVMQREQVGEGL